MASYIYDGDRLVRTVTASPWGDEDQALMLAWRTYQDSLCAGCGHPKATAWHHMNEDAFDLEGEFICWACTAAKPRDKDGHQEPAVFPVVVDTRDYDRFPLPGPPEPQISAT